MKRFLIPLLFLASSAFAQEAPLTVPVTRTSEAKYTLNRFDCNFVANVCVISLDVKDAGNITLRYFNLTVPDSAHPSATFTGMLNAAGTTRATETGVAERRANFRIIGYLFDQGYLSGISALTP